jgi:hypothetical protein
LRYGEVVTDDEIADSADAGSVVLRLRALAHPLRWQLIDAIESEGTATATRCAQLTGESVASCSYHLGVLAKYGYIEAVPSETRERPWRLTSRHQELSAPDGDVASVYASDEAIDAFLEHEFERIRGYRRTRSLEPKTWRKAGVVGGATMWVTAEELRGLKKELLTLLQRYEERSDPTLRPAGARLARLFVASSVSPSTGSRRKSAT